MEPAIELFTLDPAGRITGREPLFDPPEVFDLAFAAGGVLAFFARSAASHESIAHAWDHFRRYALADAARADAARKSFARYCANASDLGSLTGETAWCRNPSEFQDEIGVFLGRLLFGGDPLRNDTDTAAIIELLQVFERLVAHFIQNIGHVNALNDDHRADILRRSTAGRGALEKLLAVLRRAREQDSIHRLGAEEEPPPAAGRPYDTHHAGAQAADAKSPGLHFLEFPFERITPDEICLFEVKPGKKMRFVEPLMTAPEFAHFALHMMGAYMLAQQMTHEKFKTVLGYLHRFREILSPAELANMDVMFERYARRAWPNDPEAWSGISPHIRSFLLQTLLFNGGIDKTLFALQSAVINMCGACISRLTENESGLLSLAGGNAERAFLIGESMKRSLATCEMLGKLFAGAAEKDRCLVIHPRIPRIISDDAYVAPPVLPRAEDLIQPIGPDKKTLPEGPWDLWLFAEPQQGEPEPIGLLMKVAHFAAFSEMFSNVYQNLIDHENKQLRNIADTIRNIGNGIPDAASDMKRLFRRFIAAGCISAAEDPPTEESFESIPDEIQVFLARMLISSAPLSEEEMMLLRGIAEFFGRFWRAGLTHPENWEAEPEHREALTHAMELCIEIADRLAQYMNMALTAQHPHFIRVRGQ